MINSRRIYAAARYTRNRITYKIARVLIFKLSTEYLTSDAVLQFIDYYGDEMKAEGKGYRKERGRRDIVGGQSLESGFRRARTRARLPFSFSVLFFSLILFVPRARWPPEMDRRPPIGPFRRDYGHIVGETRRQRGVSTDLCGHETQTENVIRRVRIINRRGRSGRARARTYVPRNTCIRFPSIVP